MVLQGHDVRGLGSNRLTPPQTGGNEQPRDEAVRLFERTDQLHLFVGQAIGWPLLDPRQDSPRKGAPIDESDVLAPIQHAAEIRQDVPD